MRNEKHYWSNKTGALYGRGSNSASFDATQMSCGNILHTVTCKIQKIIECALTSVPETPPSCPISSEMKNLVINPICPLRISNARPQVYDVPTTYKCNIQTKQRGTFHSDQGFILETVPHQTMHLLSTKMINRRQIWLEEFS